MEIAFQVDVDIVSDRNLYLSDAPPCEGEVGVYSLLTESPESRPMLNPSPASAN
jgi:hypothetical protein